MEKYLNLSLVGGIGVLLVLLLYQASVTKKYRSLYYKERQNVEAYQSVNSSLQESVIQYRESMDELRASKDALDQKILNIVDSLKIKDKRIKEVQYQTSVIEKTDTLHLRDTVFIDRVSIDTIIGDAWYTMKVGLYHPSKVVVSPSFKSEQYVVIHNSRKYNKKPSKLFFVRWFQKKHTVTEVHVVEKNPYIDIKERRYINVEE